VAVFASVLSTIRERNDVESVFVGVIDLNTDDFWPFSDRVYIITGAPLAEVKRWFQPLSANEIEELVPYIVPPGLPKLQFGQKAYLVWWD
jgi:hypothetical protein